MAFSYILHLRWHASRLCKVHAPQGRDPVRVRPPAWLEAAPIPAPPAQPNGPVFVAVPEPRPVRAWQARMWTRFHQLAFIILSYVYKKKR